jgi:hypothetical protein
MYPIRPLTYGSYTLTSGDDLYAHTKSFFSLYYTIPEEYNTKDYVIFYVKLMNSRETSIRAPDGRNIERASIMKKVLTLFVGRIYDLMGNGYYNNYIDNRGNLRSYHDREYNFDDMTREDSTKYAFLRMHNGALQIYITSKCCITNDHGKYTINGDIEHHDTDKTGIIENVPLLVGLSESDVSIVKTKAGVKCYKIRTESRNTYLFRINMGRAIYYNIHDIVSMEDIHKNYTKVIEGDAELYFENGEDKPTYKYNDGELSIEIDNSPVLYKRININHHNVGYYTHHDSDDNRIVFYNDIGIRHDTTGWHFRNELSAHIEALRNKWPVAELLHYNGDAIEIKQYKYNASIVPPGFTKETWARHVIQFCESLPFIHGCLECKYIVYDDPQDLRVMYLYCAKKLDGTFFINGGPENYYGTSNRHGMGHIMVEILEDKIIVDCYADGLNLPQEASELMRLAWSYRDIQ